MTDHTATHTTEGKSATLLAPPPATPRLNILLEKRPAAPSDMFAMWSASLRECQPDAFAAACLRVLDPNGRHTPVHGRLRPAPEPVALEHDVAAPTRTSGDTQPRVLRRFLSLALVAVSVIAATATTGAIGLGAAMDSMEADPQSAVQATATAAAARKEASASAQPQELRVHIQTQASLRPGGQQQFRLAIDNGSRLRRSNDASANATLFMVDFAIHPQRSDDTSVSVSPVQLVATQHELNATPIWIEVAAGVACDADLGELQVRVRELAADGMRGTTTVTLPQVDCREGPPAIGLRQQ